jgi:hypothetical protein
MPRLALLISLALVAGCEDEASSVPASTETRAKPAPRPEAEEESEASTQEEAAPSTRVARVRTADGQPVPVFPSVEIRSDEEAPHKGYAVFGDAKLQLPSPTEVLELLDVETYPHHGPIAAYRIRTSQAEGWVQASHVLMAGIIEYAKDTPTRVWSLADQASPVIDELIEGETIFYDPAQHNPFDGHPGCDGSLVRVVTARELEGYASCTHIR